MKKAAKEWFKARYFKPFSWPESCEYELQLSHEKDVKYTSYTRQRLSVKEGWFSAFQDARNGQILNKRLKGQSKYNRTNRVSNKGQEDRRFTYSNERRENEVRLLLSPFLFPSFLSLSSPFSRFTSASFFSLREGREQSGQRQQFWLLVKQLSIGFDRVDDHSLVCWWSQSSGHDLESRVSSVSWPV